MLQIRILCYMLQIKMLHKLYVYSDSGLEQERISHFANAMQAVTIAILRGVSQKTYPSHLPVIVSTNGQVTNERYAKRLGFSWSALLLPSTQKSKLTI